MAESSVESGVRSRRLTALGGREDLARVYYRARDFIYKYNLLRLCRFEESDGLKQLEISHLWRIQRLADGSIKAASFSLSEERWIDEKESGGASLQQWPFIPLFPVAKTRSLSWSRKLAETIISKALEAAGFASLPSLGQGMSPYHMSDLLKNRLLGKYQGRDGNGEPVWSGGRLKHESLLAGARALRAVFYDHFYEKAVLSGVMLIDYQYRSLTDYLRYALWREGFLKVAAEHRNLLPLLKHINPESWSRDDLFSRKLWIKDGRKSTALDRKPLKNSYELCGSFQEPAAWKWLLKASPMLVKEIARKNKSLVVNLALANINFKAPVMASVQVLRSDLRRIDRVSPEVQRFIRLFLAHCASRWREEGFGNFRQWLKTQGRAALQDAIDYLLREGIENGQPDRNATWASILRRSGDWHQRVALEMMEIQENVGKNSRWEPVLAEVVIDGISFKALTTPKELALEGYELHHCVGSYAAACLRNQYRVYSVAEPGGARSTLGLSLEAGSVNWSQHRGPCNHPVSEAAEQAGPKLVEALRAAIRKQSEFKPAA